MLGTRAIRTILAMAVMATVQAQIFITEIMYEPRNGKPEYIELWNGGDTAVDMTGKAFTKGIDYNFPSGTVIQPDGVVLISSDVDDFKREYTYQGTLLEGDWDGKLSGKGENLKFTFGRGSIRYHNGEQGWPTMPDKDAGYSINLIDVMVSASIGPNWIPSSPSPGVVQVSSKTLIVSEIMVNPSAPTATEHDTIMEGKYDLDDFDTIPNVTASDFEFIELFNPSVGRVYLNGLTLVSSGTANKTTLFSFDSASMASIAPWAAVVVARDPTAFLARYNRVYSRADLGVNLFGGWDGEVHLMTSDQVTININNKQEEVVSSFVVPTSSISAPGAGEGHSAVFAYNSKNVPTMLNILDDEQWTGSAEVGGSPGMWTRDDSVCEIVGLPAFFEPSGLAYNYDKNFVIVVSDNGFISKFDSVTHSLQQTYGVVVDPGGEVYKTDLEGATIADSASPLIYLGQEYDPETNKASILEFDLSIGRVRRRFELTDLPVNEDDGLESLTFVPDEGHPEGGYFYVGNQKTGDVTVFELPIKSSPFKNNATLKTHFSWVSTNIAGLSYYDGHLFSSTPARTTNLVHIFNIGDDPLMKPVWTEQSPEVPVPDAEGIAVGPNTRLVGGGEDIAYVASDSEKRVVVLSWDGEEFRTRPCNSFYYPLPPKSPTASPRTRAPTAPTTSQPTPATVEPIMPIDEPGSGAARRQPASVPVVIAMGVWMWVN